MAFDRAVYMRDVIPRPRILAAWDRFRSRYNIQWLAECFAESFGVFLFVYFGIGSAIALVLGNILDKSLSSVFQLGWAYTFGVLFALTVCTPTSGGHFNPCITIAFILLKGFPVIKGVRYIICQILGAYIACMLVYNQWKFLIKDAEQALMDQGGDVFATTIFTPNGPAGAFALYLTPGQEFGRVFLNEFVNCAVIGVIIWACLDPTSFLIPPAFGPVIVSMSYGAAIWSFLTPGIALNTARDVGGRLMAITIWGTKAAGGRYAAIAALTNIPATLFGAFLYEMFLGDPNRTISPAHLEHINHQVIYARRLKHGETESHADRSSSRDKGSVEEVDITGIRVV